jgi:hypothetical protein
MNPKIGTSEHYLPFVLTLLNKLECIPDPEEMLWHYTTSAGLIGIIESGSIFATQVSCLNDSTEIRYYSMSFRTALTEQLENIDDEATSKFLKRYVTLLQDEDTTPMSADLPYFVTCFTPLQDDVNHWRDYGGGENGYAIGVRTRDLSGPGYSLVGRVNYNSQVHTAIAREAAQKTVEYYREGLQSGLTNWDDRFLKVWDFALTQLTPFVKEPGFAAEKEVRFVHYLQESEISELKVLPRQSMLSQHLPMRFGEESKGKPRFPISKVIVGPCRHRQISRRGVDMLLRTHGYPGNLVVTSEKPYQETQFRE